MLKSHLVFSLINQCLCSRSQSSASFSSFCDHFMYSLTHLSKTWAVVWQRVPLSIFPVSYAEGKSFGYCPVCGGAWKSFLGRRPRTAALKEQFIFSSSPAQQIKLLQEAVLHNAVRLVSGWDYRGIGGETSVKDREAHSRPEICAESNAEEFGVH